jgi:N-acetylmuramoyl-L-alanine amidase
MMPFMSESGEWYQIEIEEGLSGWISKTYSTLREVTPEVSSPVPEEELMSELSPLHPDPQPPSDAMVLVTVGEESTLNVRSIPSASGAVVDMLFGGDKLPLVKEEGEWYQVRFEDETTGWISKKFSVIEGRAPVAPLIASVPEPRKKTAGRNTPGKKASDKLVTTVIVIKVPEGSALNVRSTPSSQGQVLGSLKRGDMRPLLEETGEWYQVELPDGQSGWVSQKFSGKMDVDPSFIQNP